MFELKIVQGDTTRFVQEFDNPIEARQKSDKIASRDASDWEMAETGVKRVDMNYGHETSIHYLRQVGGNNMKSDVVLRYKDIAHSEMVR